MTCTASDDARSFECLHHAKAWIIYFKGLLSRAQGTLIWAAAASSCCCREEARLLLSHTLCCRLTISEEAA